MGAERATIDTVAVRKAVADLIRGLGLDPARDGELADTPERVADFYREALAGLDPAAEPELAVMPHAGGGDLVVVRDLPFHSLCIHHLAPFFGHVTVAYLPAERLIGISGPARLVGLYSRRLQLQERMTAQIADHLERLIAPHGVMVRVTARHLCMEMRGVRTHGAVETRTVRGALAEPRWAEALRPPPEGARG